MENLSASSISFPNKIPKKNRLITYFALLCAFLGWGFGNFPVLLIGSLLAIPLGLVGFILSILTFVSFVQRKMIGKVRVILFSLLALFAISWECANLFYVFHEGKPIWGFFKTVDLLYQPPLKVGNIKS